MCNCLIFEGNFKINLTYILSLLEINLDEFIDKTKTIKNY